VSARVHAAAERPAPTIQSNPQRHVPLNVQRHRGGRQSPWMDPRGDNVAGSVAERSRAARARRKRPAPAVVAAHRFDHPPITDRSRVSAARSSVDHPPLGAAVAG